MATPDIPPERVRRLNDRGDRAGRYVLYWMQQSQRAEFNHALEYAAGEANARGLPLLVAFGLMDGYPEATLRHYRFMLEGLRETQDALRGRGVLMVVRHGNPDDIALGLAADAALVVCDRGYLRHQKAWRERVAGEAGCAVVQIESDVVVPVDAASDKAEVGARTLRPRVTRLWPRFLVPLRARRVDVPSLDLDVTGLDLSDLDRVLDTLTLDRSVPPVPLFTGGTAGAKAILRRFTRESLDGYTDHRNRPGTDYVSHMSKYLHFGQISPVYVALTVRAAAGPAGDEETYLDELLVRRELAQNYVHFTPDYDRYDGLPAWARATLAAHRGDPRPHVYTRAELEAAGTHDPYWNAAMREMVHTGYMHNHMRMYWGKKILEWSATPEEGFDTALRLNNKYFLDGRDANSFANVAWVFGRHDRPWPERPVFGQVRSMTARGLEQKTDVKAYVEKVEAAVRGNGSPARRN